MSKLIGAGGKDGYYLLGVDLQEKRLGIPTWGWGAGIAAVLYYFLRKKRR